jgi:tetratricopeptide (TPR) repeat protein
MAQMPFGHFMAGSRGAGGAGTVSLLVGDSAFRAALAATTPAEFGATDGFELYWAKAESYRLSGRAALGRVYYDSMAALVRPRLAAIPDDAFYAAALGVAEAYLGHAAEAIAHARHAEALEPLQHDHFFGALILQETAQIYMAVGQPDSAVSRLRTLVHEPSNLSAARLAADPEWAPLRGDPEFERLVGGRAAGD